MDIAEARAAGMLVGDPDDAWGNAALPRFGIGRPVSPPHRDPGAARKFGWKNRTCGGKAGVGNLVPAV